MKAKEYQMYYVELPADAVESDMVRLAQALEPVVMAKVRLVTRMAFEVSDRRASEIIQVVVDATAEERSNGNGNGKQPAGMTRASYRFVKSGEVITTRALNKRLADRDISLVRAVLENHKGERFVILAGEGLGGPELALLREPVEPQP